MNTEHHGRRDEIILHLIAGGSESVAEVMTFLLNATTRIERETSLVGQYFN